MLSDIVSRLKGSCPALKFVGGAADYKVIDNQKPPLSKLPAAYVIPLAERADRNSYASGAVSQRVHSFVGVLLVVTGAASDPRGEGASFAIEAVRAQVRAALLGWTPDATKYDPFTVTLGDIVDLDGQALWWQETFETAYTLRG